MKRVTDPDLLRQLEGSSLPTDAGKPITDPATIAALEGGSAPMGIPEGIAQNFAQGSTLGFADEQMANIGALAAQVDRGLTKAGDLMLGRQRAIPDSGNVVADRKAALDDIRSRLAGFNEQNPGTAIASTIAGGLVTGGGAVKAANALGAPVRGMAGGATLGGGSGAVAGAGFSEGETVGEVFKDAAFGAATGAGFGALLAGAGGAAKAAWRKLAPGVQNRIALIAKSSKYSPAQIRSRLLALGPKATLADVDTAFGKAAGAAAARLGPAMKNVEKYIARDKTQLKRIMAPIRRIVGGADDAEATVADLKLARETQGSALYERAYAQPFKYTDKIKDLMTRPAVKTAWRKVQASGKNDPDIDIASLGDPAEPGMRGLTQVAGELWEKSDRLYRAGEKVAAGNIRKLRRTLLQEMDGQNDIYRQARAVWADSKRADDMMDLGSDFLRMKPSEVREALKDMSPADKDFYRLGIGRAIEEKMASTVDSADVTRFARNAAFRRKVFDAFPSRRDAVSFLRTIENEADMKATSNTIVSNSETAVRQAVQKQLMGADISPDDVTKAGIWNRLSGLAGPREKTIQDVGELLTAQDPAAHAMALRMMQSAPAVAPQGLSALEQALIVGQGPGTAAVSRAFASRRSASR